MAPSGISNRRVCRRAGGEVVSRSLYLKTPRSRLMMDRSNSGGNYGIGSFID